MKEHVEEWISAFIDHELEEADHTRVAAHLAACPRCRAIYEELLNIRERVRTAYDNVVAPDDMEQRILSMINSEMVTTKPKLLKGIIPLTGFTVLFLLWLSLSSSWIGFKVAAVTFKVLIHLVHVLMGIVASIPYLAGGAIMVSAFLIAASSFTLYRLLRAKVVIGGEFRNES